MQSLHDRLMHIVNTNLKEGNIAPAKGYTQPNNVSHTPTPQPSAPNPSGKPTPNINYSPNYTIPMSEALHAQLMRFCEANKTVLASKSKDPDAEPTPLAPSKAIRYAVYELLRDPKPALDNAKPWPTFNTAVLPPTRTRTVSWTMPKNKPQDAAHMKYLWSTTYGGSQGAFVRRAIFNYTLAYASDDPAEVAAAAKDAWF